jgi:predicted amidohydrolase
MLLVAFLIGLTVSTANPVGIVAALVLLPAVVLRQSSRWRCYTGAAGYYGGALWPLAVGAKNFFGPDVSALGATSFWAVCGLLLALPYALFWTHKTKHLIWRAPSAILIGVIPPLGLIGFASPLTASGFLFPAWSWAGLALSLCGCGLVAAHPRYSIPGLTAVAVVANLLSPGDRRPPLDWQAVDTHFGAISHGPASPLREYLAALEIQGQAAASSARVVVFPESVVPRWTASTDLFWKPTIDRLRQNGKVMLIGSLIPQSLTVRNDYFGTAVGLLGAAGSAPPALEKEQPFYYLNAAIIRGAQSGVFVQRVPVPVSVWKPLGHGGAPLRLASASVVQLAGQRAAILICYEQVIPWTALTAALARPTLFVGMANDHWASGTTIPEWQALCLRAWSRLFFTPYLLAVNN